MAVRLILVALIVVSSAFIAPAGAQTTTDYPETRTSPLGRAVTLAKAASLEQATGIPTTIELNAQAHSDLTSEITALTTQFGMRLTPLQVGQVASLRSLDGDLQAALADTIGAFTGFKIAASAGTLADVVAARGVLLDSVVRLSAFGAADVENAEVCEPLDLTPLLLLDTTDCNNVHWRSVALSIDFGGDDEYYNNAGGASVLVEYGVERPAAAAIDLDGDDLYFQYDSAHLGNGSATIGSGFLLDAAGNDTYIGGNGSAGGWANLPGPLSGLHPPSLVASGFLMDVGGDDFYRGNNGYAATGPISYGAPLTVGVARALLFDGGGFDSYGSGTPSSPGPIRTECTVAPKGRVPSYGIEVAVGAQIDFPHTDCPI